MPHKPLRCLSVWDYVTALPRINGDPGELHFVDTLCNAGRFDSCNPTMFYVKKYNKYGAKKQEFNGRWYHSGIEADVARGLEMAKKATLKSERVVTITPQYSIDFWIDKNGKIDDVQSEGAIKICQYRPDFYITYADGSEEILEVKGLWLSDALLKWRLTEALYSSKYPDVKLTIIKDDRNKKFNKFNKRFAGKKD